MAISYKFGCLPKVYNVDIVKMKSRTVQLFDDVKLFKLQVKSYPAFPDGHGSERKNGQWPVICLWLDLDTHPGNIESDICMTLRPWIGSLSSSLKSEVY